VTSKHKDGSISHRAGDVYKKKINPGKGVHVAYEDKMIDANIDDIMEQLLESIDQGRPRDNSIKTGQEAAFAVLELMKQTQNILKPESIVNAFIQAKKDGKNVSQHLYEEFEKETIQCLAIGAQCLADIWQGAWQLYPANLQPVSAIAQEKLIDLYRSPEELPSMYLDTVSDLLKQ
jgi:hypothetical protein